MNYSFLTVQDIWLASALSSFGVPFYQPDPIRRVRKDGREIVLFNFEETDEAKSIVKGWADKEFIEKNPEQPLAYVKAFSHNRERLLDLVKQSPAVQIVQRGSRIYLIPVKSTTPQESK